MLGPANDASPDSAAHRRARRMRESAGAGSGNTCDNSTLAQTNRVEETVRSLDRPVSGDNGRRGFLKNSVLLGAAVAIAQMLASGSAPVNTIALVRQYLRFKSKAFPLRGLQQAGPMNVCIYDRCVGRFLSTDPIILPPLRRYRDV